MGILAIEGLACGFLLFLIGVYRALCCCGVIITVHSLVGCATGPGIAKIVRFVLHWSVCCGSFPRPVVCECVLRAGAGSGAVVVGVFCCCCLASRLSRVLR